MASGSLSSRTTVRTTSRSTDCSSLSRRAANVEGLGLDTAGVKYDARKGVEVNDRLQTTNPNIYAAGDVCSPYKVYSRCRLHGPHRDPERVVPQQGKGQRVGDPLVYVYFTRAGTCCACPNS